MLSSLAFLLLLAAAAASAQDSNPGSRGGGARQDLLDSSSRHSGALYAVDLTHTLSDVAPVTEGASPLEMIRFAKTYLNIFFLKKYVERRGIFFHGLAGGSGCLEFKFS